MHSEYAVWTASELQTGEVAISGLVVGPRLSIGQEGSSASLTGNIKVVIVGIGVSDPNLGQSDRQGILVKILEGKVAWLEGRTLEFEGQN